MAIVKRLDVLLSGDASPYVKEMQKAGAATTDLQKTVAGVDLSKGLAAPDLSNGIKADARKVGGIIASLRRELDKVSGADDLGSKVVDLERLGGSPAQVQFARSMVAQIEERKESMAAAAKAERDAAAAEKERQRQAAADAVRADQARDLYVANEMRRTQQLNAARRQSQQGAGGTMKGDAAEALGTIERLKRVLGGRGSAKDILEIAAGTGPVIALTMAGRMLSDMTGKAIELRDAFRDGAKSAGGVADELMRSVPILGQLYSTGRNLRELWLDENGAVKKIADETARINARTDLMQLHLKAFKEDARELASLAKEIGDHFATMGLSGPKMDAARAKIDTRDQLEEISKAKAKALIEDAAVTTAKGNLKTAIDDQRAFRPNVVPGDLPLDKREYIAANPERAASVLAEYQAIRNQQAKDLQDKVNQARADLKKETDRINGTALLKGLMVRGRGFADTTVANVSDFIDRHLGNLGVQQARDAEARDRQRQQDQIGWDSTFKAIERDESMSLGRRLQARLAFIDKLDKSGSLEKVEAARMRAEAQDDLDASAAQIKALAMTPSDRLAKRVDDLRDLLTAGKIDAREFDVGVGAARRDIFGDHRADAVGGYRMSAPIIAEDLAMRVPGFQSGGTEAVKSPEEKTAAALKELQGDFKRAVSFLQLLYQGLVTNTGGSGPFATATIP